MIWKTNTWNVLMCYSLVRKITSVAKIFFNDSLFILIVTIDFLFKYKLNIRKKLIFLSQYTIPIEYVNTTYLLYVWYLFKLSWL